MDILHHACPEAVDMPIAGGVCDTDMPYLPPPPPAVPGMSPGAELRGDEGITLRAGPSPVGHAEIRTLPLPVQRACPSDIQLFGEQWSGIEAILDIESDKVLSPDNQTSAALQAVCALAPDTMGRGRGGLLCDDAGAGKTRTMLVAARLADGDVYGASDLRTDTLLPPTLVVVSKTLVPTWMAEARRVGFDCAMSVDVGAPQPSDEALRKARLVITTYEVVRLQYKSLMGEYVARVSMNQQHVDTDNRAWDAASDFEDAAPTQGAHDIERHDPWLYRIAKRRLVIDEAHILCNMRTSRYRALVALSATLIDSVTGVGGRVWYISATPISNNRHGDIITAVSLLQLSGFARFAEASLATHNSEHWKAWETRIAERLRCHDPAGWRNAEPLLRDITPLQYALRHLLSRRMIRRTKRAVKRARETGVAPMINGLRCKDVRDRDNTQVLLSQAAYYVLCLAHDKSAAMSRACAEFLRVTRKIEHVVRVKRPHEVPLESHLGATDRGPKHARHLPAPALQYAPPPIPEKLLRIVTGRQPADSPEEEQLLMRSYATALRTAVSAPYVDVRDLSEPFRHKWEVEACLETLNAGRRLLDMHDRCCNPTERSYTSARVLALLTHLRLLSNGHYSGSNPDIAARAAAAVNADSIAALPTKLHLLITFLTTTPDGAKMLRDGFVVFSNFIKTLDVVSSVFARLLHLKEGVHTAKLHGKLTSAARESVLRRVDKRRIPNGVDSPSGLRILFATEQIGGVGVNNLVTFNAAISLDSWWMSRVQQMIGRIDRPGQDPSASLRFIRLFVTDSIEEHVRDVAGGKEAGALIALGDLRSMSDESDTVDTEQCAYVDSPRPTWRPPFSISSMSKLFQRVYDDLLKSTSPVQDDGAEEEEMVLGEGIVPAAPTPWTME